MLKDEIIAFMNPFFKKINLAVAITDLFLFRPVVHELPFEGLEPINDVNRLKACSPTLCIEIDIEDRVTTQKQPLADKSRILSYYIECKKNENNGSKNGNKFVISTYWCKGADYYPEETPADIEKVTKQVAEPVFDLLLKILELFMKG
jgi:hypothetical protein